MSIITKGLTDCIIKKRAICEKTLQYFTTDTEAKVRRYTEMFQNVLNVL